VALLKEYFTEPSIRQKPLNRVGGPQIP